LAVALQASTGVDAAQLGTSQGSQTLEAGSLPSERDRGRRWYSFERISAVYIIIVLIALFSILQPSQFPTYNTFTTVLNENSVSGIVALAVIVPLAAGLFDLSVGYMLGLSGVFSAFLLGHTSLPAVVVIIVTLLMAAGVGLVNSFLVVVMEIPSLIATLGSGSILFAITIGISGDVTISNGVTGTFSLVTATASIHGFTIPVLYCLIVLVVLACWLGRSQMGRQWYSIGFDKDVSILSGIRVKRLEVVALCIASVCAAIAGMILTGQVGGASPDAGLSYLLPAFAGAFLGSTQIFPGRFNAWGTGLAILLLGIGDTGILMVGGPIWIPNVFEGAALIVAVALSGHGRQRVLGAFRAARGGAARLVGR